LPGTTDDEEQFAKLLENFRFSGKWDKYVLQEPTTDEINKVMDETYKIVRDNSRAKKGTLLIFFYAGHGAMLAN